MLGNGKKVKDRAPQMLKTGTAFGEHIQDYQGEQPWLCSWVVAHTSISAIRR